jgi:3-methyladenine DNA glycosylase Tag
MFAEWCEQKRTIIKNTAKMLGCWEAAQLFKSLNFDEGKLCEYLSKRLGRDIHKHHLESMYGLPD